MALTSIVNLNEGISNPSATTGQGNQEGALSALNASVAALATPIQDVFTPSTQINTAQEAGLFQVNQLSFFPAPVQIAPAEASNAGSVQATALPGTQNQIQSFNQALAALGLQNNDIQKLDQIAALVNSFSPTAFSDLISQFRALAQQQAQLASPISNSAANSISGGYQVQGLAIQFTGSRGSQSVGAVSPAAGLQIEQVQLSLLNAGGQAINLLAPRQKSSAIGSIQNSRGATP